MAYIAENDPNSTENLTREAYAEQFEIDFPNWQEREAADRFLTARDMGL